MSYQRLLSFLAVALLLAGCTGANVQPGSASEPGADGQGFPVTTGEAQDLDAFHSQPPPPKPSQVAPAQAPAPAPADALETISNRITLLQEQILQLKVQNGALAERSQLLLTQFQILAQDVKRANPGTNNRQEPSPQQDFSSISVDQLVSRLDQQLMELEQLSPALGAGNAFRLATTYSAKRKWILVRYNRLTGESWISEGGSWVPLNDDSPLNISEYEIQIQRAASDAKGYVAARIDKNTGDTWWLNEQQWVLYE